MDAPLAAHDELEMLHRVGDVDVVRSDPRCFHRVVQKAPGGADERMSFAVFAVAGLLADEDCDGAAIALAEHRLRRVLVEIAAAAALRGFLQARERPARGKEVGSGAVHGAFAAASYSRRTASMSAAGLGSCRSSSSSVSATMRATARLRNHLWSAGIEGWVVGQRDVAGGAVERPRASVRRGGPRDPRRRAVVAVAGRIRRGHSGRLVELPPALLVVEALLEAAQLLVGADVQEELQDVGPRLREVLLELVDAVVPLAPHVLGDETVHARNEHVFVV